MLLPDSQPFQPYPSGLLQVSSQLPPFLDLGNKKHTLRGIYPHKVCFRDHIIYLKFRNLSIQFLNYRLYSENNGADHGILVRSTIPAPLLSNSPASASSVAWTMYQKYGNAMPLYRQEKDWKTLYEY